MLVSSVHLPGHMLNLYAHHCTFHLMSPHCHMSQRYLSMLFIPSHQPGEVSAGDSVLLSLRFGDKHVTVDLQLHLKPLLFPVTTKA